ncbi:Rieske (2Fe-2S) protein [Streptomyces toxytricini]|uniref:Cytochrome bc1 complex Rieske iron-sulfur subunit n=1 Tax=Streptomyces toxytricini TaxID=67369 RepID=A0ABW8ECQ3_STRT5
MGDTTRRRTVLAAGAATLAGAALTACGGEGGSQAPDASGAQGAPPASDPAAGGAGAGDPAAGGAGAGSGRTLARTSDIPVGGGKVFKDRKVVVTQPTAGQFKAFSATCTHQGCSVASVADGNIVCPCHQSLFKVSDGSVTSGPATRPLAPAKISVDGDSISLA